MRLLYKIGSLAGGGYSFWEGVVKTEWNCDFLWGSPKIKWGIQRVAKAKQKSGDGLQANNNSYKTIKSVFVTVKIRQMS